VALAGRHGGEMDALRGAGRLRGAFVRWGLCVYEGRKRGPRI